MFFKMWVYNAEKKPASGAGCFLVLRRSYHMKRSGEAKLYKTDVQDAHRT